ncbi:MAG: FkbM family methyltransferase [Burkholderiales bacterium]|nr:FkbM family methyltransferase [Burkholderiales bacterium]
MKNYPTNQERTAEYLEKFDRERTLKYLIECNRPVIFDVGANVGSTLDEFKLWWPDSEVHCFEPQQECWESLEQRAGKYAPADVVINRFAAGSAPNDQAPFYSHDISSGISGFNRINLQSRDSVHLNRLIESDPRGLPEYEQSLNHERSVKIVRLNDYLNTSGIQRVHLLKIDTQGYEPEVLEGFGARLADVDVVITELMFYDYYERSLSFSDIERFLLPAGFHLYDISHIAKNPMNGRTDWVDVIYVNNRIRTGGRRA